MEDRKKPKVARVVMFKSGVAYVERGGPADGSFDLAFRRDDMNDVLKSLAAWVAAGRAKVGPFEFDAAEDPDAALARRGLLFEQGAALEGLLASLRGRTVLVERAGRRAKGEVLGLQHDLGPNGERRTSLLLRSSSGAVRIVDLRGVYSIELLEGTSRERLDFLVERDRAATEGETRTVRVTLEGAAQDLRVAYTIPAPVWRASYRVVRDGDSATLMAMGIVQNPIDEDLDRVSLTLTTGEPVSFVIDLYHPRMVERPVLEEEARTGALPTRYERAKSAAKRGPTPGMDGHEEAAPPMPSGGMSAADSMGRALGEAAAGASQGAERGELFEYKLSSPVSIRRGGSAIVPLASKRVAARQERIWRDGMVASPDLVLAFTNDTGLVLEEGPAVIYDGGAYAGESMLPYSPRGEAVRMTFAKDLAARVTRRTEVSTVTASVRIERDGLLEEQRIETHHRIEAESDHDEAIEIIVEMPKVTGHTLSADSAQPFEETASYRRFRIEVPAHGKAAISVREAQPVSRRVAVESIDPRDLERWFRDRHLDDATYRALSGVLAHLREARQFEQRRKQVEAQRAEVYEKQKRISEQLAVLKETGPEGELRLRYVKELAAAQDEVNAAEAEARRLDGAIAEARRLAKEELEKLIKTP